MEPEMETKGNKLAAPPDQAVMEDVLGYKDVADLVEVSEDGIVRVGELDRGTLKQVLIKLGYPVDDRGGYLTGDSLEVDLCEETSSGKKSKKMLIDRL